MPGDPIRVLSDIHYGDRSSRVVRMEALRPLADGAAALVLNGDTLDTRPGPRPEHTDLCRREVVEFFSGVGAPVTFITGNHDPDISGRHWLDLAQGRVWAFHGDVLFDEVVPWATDAGTIRRRVRSALSDAGGRADALPLRERMELLRVVTRAVPQRHQSEPRAGRYLLRLCLDLLWPPWRVPRLIGAWRTIPERARRFVRLYRPQARFALIGHTHRPGIWRAPKGVTVVNTGAFTRPFPCWVADVEPDRLRIRSVRRAHGEFRLDGAVAEFAF
ncbi:MAG: metallophosphoesterase [Opitutaceae bacterium]